MHSKSTGFTSYLYNFNEGHSEIDNDAYCVCTHDFSLCMHKNFRSLRTMFAVKISGTHTVLSFMFTQIKYL